MSVKKSAPLVAKNETPVINSLVTGRSATTKQFGDACEHYVVAMLGFANVPAMKAPDCWPGYDVIAQPAGRSPQRISVKGRRWPCTALAFKIEVDVEWEWLALVVINDDDKSTRCWMLPRHVAETMSTQMPVAGERRLNLTTLWKHCTEWENKFSGLCANE